MNSIARIPYLKLEPSSSRVKPGNSLEVDCTSSVGPQVKVIWEGLDKSQLPFNFEVKHLNAFDNCNSAKHL